MKQELLELVHGGGVESVVLHGRGRVLSALSATPTLSCTPMDGREGRNLVQNELTQTRPGARGQGLKVERAEVLTVELILHTATKDESHDQTLITKPTNDLLNGRCV